ncbi:taste receptor type 2 member 143-like [Rhynchocyon petersi]
MPSLPMLFLMVAFFLESLVAMLQNGFMVAVLGLWWARGRVMLMGDMIVACLATCRLGLHVITVLNNLLVIFNFHRKVGYYFGILWDFSNMLTFWLTACLSTFYCVKIASFSHPTFLWLRWRLSRSVSRLLLAALAMSVLATIPSVIGNAFVIQLEISQLSHTNGSWPDRARVFHRNFFLLYEVLTLTMPFLLFLGSTALLLVSLLRHLGQMRAGQAASPDPSTQAHIMAIKSLFFFLVFYSFYFLSLMVALMKSLYLQLYMYWAWQVVTYAGISLHSTILLFSSPRFRKALKRGVTGCGALDRGPHTGTTCPY